MTNKHSKLKIVGDTEKPYSSQVVDSESGEIIPYVYSFDIHAEPRDAEVSVKVMAAFEIGINPADLKYVMMTHRGTVEEIDNPQIMKVQLEAYFTLLRRITFFIDMNRAKDAPWVQVSKSDMDAVIAAYDECNRIVGSEDVPESSAGEAPVSAVSEED